IAEMDADTVRDELLVDGNGVRLRAEQIDRKLANAASGEPSHGIGQGFAVPDFVLNPRRHPVGQRQAQPGKRLSANGEAQRLQRCRSWIVFGLDEIEWPQRDVRAETEAARDL